MFNKVMEETKLVMWKLWWAFTIHCKKICFSHFQSNNKSHMKVPWPCANLEKPCTTSKKEWQWIQARPNNVYASHNNSYLALTIWTLALSTAIFHNKSLVLIQEAFGWRQHKNPTGQVIFLRILFPLTWMLQEPA
jgi:hypothetical protein